MLYVKCPPMRERRGRKLKQLIRNFFFYFKHLHPFKNTYQNLWGIEAFCVLILMIRLKYVINDIRKHTQTHSISARNIRKS